MAKHWDGLVLENYKAVMPLTWNRKYGFYYLYQPALTASLGVFGNNINENLVKSFLDTVPEKFSLIEISLNHANNFRSSINGYYSRSNYILHLNKPYEEILHSYRENHRRNILRAKELGCRISREISVDEIIQINRQQFKHIDGPKSGDYVRFKRLYEFLKGKDKAKSYAVVDTNNKTLASAVFFFSHNRAFYILVGNHPDGKTAGASHALIDAFIKDHASQNLILDFEGSDIPNLAFFYHGFGAKEEIYPAIKINRLPWYARLFKK
ncbi:MAG TPA: hypothetical protein VFP97_17090 [Chitinophagaceae bacterium]|nr:hypothetical protein [Chitinophagaceae bacterium]